MKLIACVIMLVAMVSADVLQLERWPILESISKDNLAALFQELQKTTFPVFKQEVGGFLIPNVIEILDLRITNLVPRFMFIKPTFYPAPDDHTFAVTMPLGFHITAEFVWVYNFFSLPISGSGIMDTDVYDFNYNTSFVFENNKTSVKTSLKYQMVNFTDAQIISLFDIDSMFGVTDIVVKVISGYSPILHKSIDDIFANIAPAIFDKHITKAITVALYYPTFHLVYNLNLPLTGVTTRESLLLVFGKVQELPDRVTAGEKVSRQYCADQGLLNTIVTGVWPNIKGVYRKGDLPKESVYQLTVTGLSQLVPDVIIDFNKDAEVLLTLASPPGNTPDIKLTKINETHGLAKGFKMLLDFSIAGTSVLKVTLTFDIVVVPDAARRGTGYAFNMKTILATVEKETIKFETKYKTVIISNINAASAEFLTYLILPFLGHTLLGDGLLISDSITANSVPEYSVAKAAVCLSLVKII